MARVKGVVSRAVLTSHVEEKTEGSKGDPVTKEAEQKAKKTGKLNPLVDPAEFGVIRCSRPRFIQLENGLWQLQVGTPMAIEQRIDTTGSMGGNVDIALRVVPQTYELCCEVLPGYDPHLAIGIFGDISDDFVLCRPQFEMSEKIVEQLTYMVPERDGGDPDEDPHYGLFGAAYLTNAYVTRIGLKSYDFTVTDARARDMLNISELKRIFGDQVLAKAKENGYPIEENDLPRTREVVRDLLKHAHAFVMLVENRGGEVSPEVQRFWEKLYGAERIITLPATKFMPQVQACVIGLTEGALSLTAVPEFLEKHNVSKEDAEKIAKSVANIPIGAQAALPNFSKRPKAGALFKNKADLWPMSAEQLAEFNKTNPATADESSEAAPTDDVEWI